MVCAETELSENIPGVQEWYWWKYIRGRGFHQRTLLMEVAKAHLQLVPLQLSTKIKQLVLSDRFGRINTSTFLLV